VTSVLRLFVPAIMLAVFSVGCSTTATRTIEGRTFLISQKEDDGKRDFGQIAPQSERGFLVTDKEVPVCSGNNKIRGGYFVQLQSVKRGQSESERKEYVAAERFRVQQCAKLALSCAATANIRCRQDDEACLEENKNFRDSTCRYFPTDEDRKKFPGIGWISDSSGAAGVSNDILLCADRDARHVSPLYWKFHTDMAWKRDKVAWESLCRRYKSQDQCENEILKAEGALASYLQQGQMPFEKWLVNILAADQPKVKESGDGILWSEVVIDVTPACGLMEKRH
jgi:hypothetical protein